jgi:hypothetical protein
MTVTASKVGVLWGVCINGRILFYGSGNISIKFLKMAIL